MLTFDRLPILAAAALVAAAATPNSATAQFLLPEFADDYSVLDLNSVPGVPDPLGGIAFKDGAPDTLLMIGAADDPAAAIYEIQVSRDSGGHVDGFVGQASLFATTPFASGGIAYGPGGVLFYTTYEFPQDGQIAQIEPGSSGPDKLIPMSSLTGVVGNSGGLSIVPQTFAGSGRLKFTDYRDLWFDAELAPDGSGTFDIVNAVQRASLSGSLAYNLAGFIFVDASYPGFDEPSALVCEFNTRSVSAMELDGNGDIIPSTRRRFLTGVKQYLGAAIDSVTGDFLFSDWATSNHIEVVRRMAGPVGTVYCDPAAPNTTGLPGRISAVGSSEVASNSVTLVVQDLPPSTFCLFLTSQTPDLVPNAGGSIGTLCLGGQIGRFVGPGQLQLTGSGGAAELALDLGAIPAGSVLVGVQAGDVWNYQAWYRDDVGGMPTSNFTDALTVTYQ